MKKVNPGFSTLTKEQRDRAVKQSVAAAKSRPMTYAMSNKPEFGVTRFANGQCLAQSITSQRSAREKHGSESPICAIGIFDTVEAANAAYIKWRDQ